MKTRLILAFCLIFFIGSVSFATTQKNTVSTPDTKVNHLKALCFPYAPWVMASPYIGGRASYDPSDLITFWPTQNEDLNILQQRAKLENILKEKCIAAPDRPLIDLSGYVEGLGLLNKDYNNDTNSDINLSGAELDVLGKINSWSTAFMAFAYDNTPPMYGTRASNSKVFIDRGFLTIGNLNRCPLYSSIGQFFMPFGDYNNYMFSSPLTEILFRAKQRAASLGFNKYGIYAAAYALAGDSYTGNKQNVNNWGANFGYKCSCTNFEADIGAGYIANTADADGMQTTSADAGYFQGFANDSGTGTGKHEKLAHKIPGVAIHANLDFFEHYHLIGEYIAGLRSFDVIDLSFNNSGAKISALNSEAAITYNIWNRPFSFAAGYERTWQALALNVPQQTIVAIIGASLLRDTIAKIEYRHDINYKSSDTSAGGGSMSMSPGGKYRDRDTVTLALDFYF